MSICEHDLKTTTNTSCRFNLIVLLTLFNFIQAWKKKIMFNNSALKSFLSSHILRCESTRDLLVLQNKEAYRPLLLFPDGLVTPLSAFCPPPFLLSQHAKSTKVIFLVSKFYVITLLPLWKPPHLMNFVIYYPENMFLISVFDKWVTFHAINEMFIFLSFHYLAYSLGTYLKYGQFWYCFNLRDNKGLSAIE